MANKFIQHKSKDEQHYFTLVASNGETIAVSEMYKSKAGMLKGIRSVRNNAGRFEVLESRIFKWSKSKGIIEQSTDLIQAKYARKEVDELIKCIEDGDEDGTKDNLGDVVVCLANVARMRNLNLLDCIETALIEIEKRQGIIINGEFVKNK